MLPIHRVWLKAWLKEHSERMRASDQQIAEQLRRSYMQLNKSEELLRMEVPKV